MGEEHKKEGGTEGGCKDRLRAIEEEKKKDEEGLKKDGRREEATMKSGTEEQERIMGVERMRGFER